MSDTTAYDKVVEETLRRRQRRTTQMIITENIVASDLAARDPRVAAARKYPFLR